MTEPDLLAERRASKKLHWLMAYICQQIRYKSNVRKIVTRIYELN